VTGALPQLLPNLRGAPGGILPLQADKRRLDRQGSRFAWHQSFFLILCRSNGRVSRPSLSLCLANIAPGQKPLTLASPVGTLRGDASRHPDGCCGPMARATRRDLLLETLALRHQLGVLARSNKRFRPADWLFLRWLWPQWQEALVLIQPATVDRWHREGTSMLAPSLATAWTTAHRFTLSRSDSANGRGELSLGCSADPRRIAETRNRHFGTHRLTLSARPPDDPVANVADILREPLRWPDTYLAGDARGTAR